MFYGIHPTSMSNQIIAFAELAAAGGFLMLVARGAGGWSLDVWLTRRRGGDKAAGPAASGLRA